MVGAGIEANGAFLINQTIAVAAVMAHNVLLSCWMAAIAAVEENGALLTRQTLEGAAIAAQNVVLSRQTEAVAAVDVIGIFVI